MLLSGLKPVQSKYCLVCKLSFQKVPCGELVALGGLCVKLGCLAGSWEEPSPASQNLFQSSWAVLRSNYNKVGPVFGICFCNALYLRIYTY